MAWATAYKAQFLQHNGLLKELRLKTDGFEGDPVEWCCGAGAVEYDRGNSDSLFPKDILVTTTVNISLFFEELYDLTDIIQSRKSVKVEIYNVTDSETEFSGWLEPWNAEHPYHAPGVEVSMMASCGLGRLKNIPYPMTIGMSTIVPALDAVQKCLAQVENGISSHVCIHTFAIGGDVTLETLRTFTCDETRWYNGSEPLMCDQVLQDILVRFSPRIFQEDNVWKIHSTSDRSRGYNGYRVYAEGNTDLISNHANSTDYYDLNKEEVLESDGATLGVGTISLEPPINKWVAEANLAPKKQIVFNGDLRLWDENGPVGWTMNMPNATPGWTRFDTGEELTPYGVKLVGNDIFVTKRKKGWASLGIFYGRLLATPPTNYIETPVSVFNPAEKSIIVEFDYAARFTGFVAIRLMNNDESEQVWINADGEIHDKNKGDFWMIDFDQKLAFTGGRSGAPVDLGKFSLEIPLYNEIDRRSGHVSTWNKIAIRFYATGERSLWDGGEGPGGDLGDTRIYGVRVLVGDAGGRATSGDYKYVLSKGADEADEGETVSLMTGDYALWWSGTTYLNDGITPTSKWRRPGKGSEEISIYRAMLLDRLSLTWKSVLSLDADVRMLSSKPLKFSSIIRVPDIDNKKFEVVRFRENLVDGIVTIRAVCIDYEEPMEGDLLTQTYVAGILQKAEDGRRDGVYPNENRPNSRNTTSIPAAEEEIIESPMFLPIPPVIFVESRDESRVVVLSDFFTEEFEDAIDDLDFVPIFKIGSKPGWTTASVDEWVVDVSGKPAQAGTYSVLVQILTEEGIVVEEVAIPITVLAQAKITYTLTPGGKIIPNQPVTITDGSDVTLTVDVESGHDAYQWIHRYQGGVIADSGFQEVAYTEQATYKPMDSESLGDGVHVIFFQLFRQTGVDEDDEPVYTQIYGQDVIIKVGDAPEDPTRTVGLELVSGGSPVGPIPGIYEYLAEWDIRPLPVGIKYDELRISILPEVEPFHTTLIPNLTDIGPGTEAEILDGSTGVATPDAGYITTTPIAVSPEEEYWLGEAPYSAAGYNSGIFVTELSGEVLSIPVGVNQIRICWAGDSLPSIDLASLLGSIFGGDAPKGSGEYTVFVRAFLSGSQVYERMEPFTILSEKPEEPQAQGGIILLGPGNPAPATNLPITGYTAQLPTSFSLLFNGFGAIQYDEITWKVLHGMGALTEANLPMYTGQASRKVYANPVTAGAQLLFWGKSSLDIGSLHQAPTRIIAEATGWLDGAKVAVAKADWFFTDQPVGVPTGITFLNITVEDLGSGPEVIAANEIEANIPESGRFYLIPGEDNRFYGAVQMSIDGVQSFNEVRQYINGVQVGTVILESGQTSLTAADMLDLLLWTRTADVDKPGLKEFEQVFILTGAEVGRFSASWTMYDETPDVKDPNECCDGGGSGDGITRLIGNGTDRVYEILHAFGSVDVSVYRTSDMVKSYPGIQALTGKVVLTFKSPVAVNARTVTIRPV